MVAEGRCAGHWHQCGHGRLRIQEGTWQAPDGARMGIFTHPTVSRHTCRHLFGRLEACFQYHELDSLLESIKETLNQASQGLCTQSLWSTPQFQLQVYTNTQAHAQTPPTQTIIEGSGVRGTTTAGGWMIRDSQGRRHHSKHGRVLFAQARQRLLQGTSETQTEPPPHGSTYSTELLFAGVDIRRTCDPPAGCGTENDIPTAKRSSGLETPQERCSRIRYARLIKTCKHARGQYYMVTGYHGMACDNNMRHVGMCIHSKGAYAYQPQGEGATDHWLLAAMARVAGQTAFKITSIPTRRELLSDARVCRR